MIAVQLISDSREIYAKRCYVSKAKVSGTKMICNANATNHGWEAVARLMDVGRQLDCGYRNQVYANAKKITILHGLLDHLGISRCHAFPSVRTILITTQLPEIVYAHHSGTTNQHLVVYVICTVSTDLLLTPYVTVIQDGATSIVLRTIVDYMEHITQLHQRTIHAFVTHSGMDLYVMYTVHQKIYGNMTVVLDCVIVNYLETQVNVAHTRYPHHLPAQMYQQIHHRRQMAAIWHSSLAFQLEVVCS